MTKKYLMLRSIEEIQKIAERFRKQSTGVNSQVTKYSAEIEVADNHFWISFDSLLEIFPMPLSFCLSDKSLEIYKEIEKQTGVFPVREFDDIPVKCPQRLTNAKGNHKA
ncbi:MAG: hypothetical protein KAX05_15560 [Bacteroidales bacterium]|nr:hypothetical protein [Bacteroidales bacterium]